MSTQHQQEPTLESFLVSAATRTYNEQQLDDKRKNIYFLLQVDNWLSMEVNMILFGDWFVKRLHFKECLNMEAFVAVFISSAVALETSQQ